MDRKKLEDEIIVFTNKVLLMLNKEINNPDSERLQHDDYIFIISVISDIAANALIAACYSLGTKDINRELELFIKILKINCEEYSQKMKEGLN